MMTFVPVLYLKSVVYPGETVNLRLAHRGDVQLIRDVLEKQKNFGICVHKGENEFYPFGTLAEVTELVKTLKNGTIYVRVKGTGVIRFLEFNEEIPGKKYKGAIIEHIAQTDFQVAPSVRELILSEVKRLYSLVQLEKKFPDGKKDLVSFDFAHKIGFNSNQEYELLTITSEIQRMEYIRRHLKAMMPVVKELELMKARIKMNGHFRNLS